MRFNDLLKALGRWALARAKEKSTWVGAAAIAGSVLPGAAPVLTGIGQVVGLVFGGALMAATTSPTAPADASAVGAAATG